MTVALTEDQTARLTAGYQIMGDNRWSDLVHLCFDDDTSLLPALQAHVDAHEAEFAKYRDNLEVTFDTMMKRLQAYQRQHGHQNVSPAEDRTLSWWVAWQKHLMNKYQLPVHHQMKLLSIQFDFRGADDDWDTNMYGWDTRRAT